MKTTQGGDIMYDLRNLAVPFVLMLAKNGMEYIEKNKSMLNQKPKSQKPKRKTQSRDKKGGCGCTSNPLIGGEKRDAINELANNLNKIMDTYTI